MFPPGGKVSSLRPPSPEVLVRVRHALLHRFNLQPEDVDDVIGDSFVDYFGNHGNSPGGDGLFAVIAHRRACDLNRQRRRELPLPAGFQLAAFPDREHLQREELESAIRRFASGRRNLDPNRLLAVVGRVLEGSSLAEACRESGIPRGSQSRYRKTLRLFFGRLNEHH